MSMPALWGRSRAELTRRFRLSAAALLLIAFAAPAAARQLIAEPVLVFVDQARILQLPDRAATVVIGNPLIADVSIQPGGLAVVTGKGYGTTNFLVLDSAGAVLTEKTLEVSFPSDRTLVVVYRGADRETYSCTPDCSTRVTLGDFPEYFDKTLSQTVTRNAQASSAGAH
jgi:hypothetical protein